MISDVDYAIEALQNMQRGMLWSVQEGRQSAETSVLASTCAEKC